MATDTESEIESQKSSDVSDTETPNNTSTNSVDTSINIKSKQIKFARTPYVTNLSELLDYETTEGRKHYERAIRPLAEDFFDCTTDNLLTFLNDINHRAAEFGWSVKDDGILWIPHRPLLTFSPTSNLLTSHGEVTIEMIEKYDATYLKNDCREAQDNAMIYHCLMNSLSKEAKDEISLYGDKIEAIDGYPSGLLLLKYIIQISHIDTHATTQSVRLKLSQLDSYMTTIGNDIKKFNLYVHMNLQRLHARGEKTVDLLTNLFKGYLAAKDKKFLKYIEDKLANHEEGQEMTAQQLMTWAKTKYDILLEKGEWEAPSPEERQILALQSTVTALQKSQSNKSNNNNRYRNKNNNNNNNNNSNRSKGGSRRDRMPDWQKTEPTGNAVWKPKTVNDKKWWWCGKATGGHCECYRQHKAVDCNPSYIPPHVQAKRKQQESNKDNNSNKDTSSNKSGKVKKERYTPNPNKKVKLTAALSSIVPQDDETSKDSQE